MKEEGRCFICGAVARTTPVKGYGFHVCENCIDFNRNGWSSMYYQQIKEYCWENNITPPKDVDRKYPFEF